MIAELSGTIRAPPASEAVTTIESTGTLFGTVVRAQLLLTEITSPVGVADTLVVQTMAMDTLHEADLILAQHTSVWGLTDTGGTTIDIQMAHTLLVAIGFTE